MRDLLRNLDRLDVRVGDGGAEWTLRSGGHRAARAAVIVVVIATVAVLIATDFRFPVFLMVVVGANVALRRGTTQGVLTGTLTAAAVERAVRPLGRQVRDGHWRVDGVNARALAGRLRQWQSHGVPETALTTEPEDVPTESYEPGQAWPAPPAAQAEPWPVLDRRDSE